MQEFLNEISENIQLTYLNKNTVRRYKYLIFRFIKYINLPKEKITLEHAREFLKYLRDKENLSIGTVNDYRSAIKYLFEVILDIGWNGRKVPYLKTYKSLPVVLSKNEVLKIISNAGDIFYKTLFSIIYSSGLRIQEALNLRLSDIDPERMQIHIRESKSGTARYTILAEKTHQLLKIYFKEYWLKNFFKWSKEDYLFCTYKKTKPITSRTVRKQFKKILMISNISKPATIHSLRHSFSSHLLENGTDLFTIKELLGHKSISSTCIYLHVVDFKQLGTKSPLDV